MFKRFANLADMTAYAVDVSRQHDRLIYAESGIYSDDHGATFRPQVSLVCEGATVVILRWNAFTDQENVSHMGKRARVEARESGDWFANYIQDAINASTKESPSTTEEPKTVSISLSWEGTLPLLLLAIENGTEEGKRIARVELQRMAKLADMVKRAPLDAQELATVLAALRFYQESGMGDPGNRSNAIHEIATNGDSVVSLDADAIDALCERLNVESTDGK